MPKLPVLSGREVARAFERLGWRFVRQRGSHMVMIKDGEQATLSIPDHREIAQGTLRALLRAANVTVEGFVDATRS